MLNGFTEISEQELGKQVGQLKQLIAEGGFSEQAGNTYNIYPDALIKLSEEVKVKKTTDTRQRPIFDLMISPDPLTIRVANRLYPALKDMGFDPVLVIGKYQMPEQEAQHKLLADFAFQNNVFNQVVFHHLKGTALSPGQQFLTPYHLAQQASISKVIENVDSVNDPEIRGYLERDNHRVAICHTFRLYNLVKPEVISIFSQVSKDGRKTEWGQGIGHVKDTVFESAYFDGIHSKNNGQIDNGQRRSLISNIHPSIQHHGVIPPFWQQYHMMKLMEKLGVDYKERSAEEIADICVEYAKKKVGIDFKNQTPQEIEEIRKQHMTQHVGVDYENDTPDEIEDKYKAFAAKNPDFPLLHIVDPYLNGMVHHLEPRFDTGNRILIAQNKVPIDLNKPVWQNYFAMEEMIVKSTLALAAAYKLGLNLKGQEQDLMQTYYHSYPGPDSKPPSYLSERVKQAILENDVPALDDFQRMGGKLCSKEHFYKIIFGDPETGTPGFVVPGTNIAKRLEERIEEAYEDRRRTKNGNNGPDQNGGGTLPENDDFFKITQIPINDQTGSLTANFSIAPGSGHLPATLFSSDMPETTVYPLIGTEVSNDENNDVAPPDITGKMG